MMSSISLTVAAVIERDQRYLVVEERVDGEQVINQPAGHVEDGEDVVNAVIREVREETAWRFVPEAITGIYLWQHPVKHKTFLRVSFCGACTDHNPEQTLDEGILAAHWYSREQLLAKTAQLRSPMVLRCIDDYLAGTRLPCNTIKNLPVSDLLRQAATL